MGNGAKVALLFACAVLAGCATNRSEVKLGSPVAVVSSGSVVTGKTAVIRLVRDERVFEQAPSDPSIPSLGFEGADRATAEVKARAIGRKRNGFGQAMGDVLLQNGQTVEGVVREHLAAALSQAGYRVVDAAAAEPSTMIVEVHVKRFWAWLQPGFWALTMHTKISTDLVRAGEASPLDISVHATESRQIATESTWIEIVDKALKEYRAQVAAKFGDAH